MSNTGGHNPESIATGIPHEWNAFCAFIETHYRVIYSVALAHVRDAEVAQEITQDVCVRLLLERENLPPICITGRLHTWRGAGFASVLWKSNFDGAANILGACKGNCHGTM